MTTDVELVLDARAELGEAPVWDARSGRLIWVDITAGVIHRTDPTTGADDTLHVGRTVGAAVPAADGRMTIAVDDGFWFADLETGELERIAPIPASDELMMNDGKTDGAGRFWAGTKDAQESRPLGTLYRLDPDRSVTPMVDGVTVSNGIGWSPEGSTMYYIDSPTHAVDVFRFDPSSSSIAERRRLVDLPEEWGLPDGMTVDEDGFLWIAFWMGSAVRRLDRDGNLVTELELPVSLVTSCAFGGLLLDELYVTTARIGLSEDQLRTEPNAGAVFRFRPGVRGTPARPFGR